MCYVPDFLDKWSEHNRRQEEEVLKYPMCDYCENHITDEHLYLINGAFICENCLEENCKKRTDDYVS